MASCLVRWWPSLARASNVSWATTGLDDVANAISDRIIIKEKTTSPRQGQVLTSVVAAKVRLAYHAGIAYRRLRRFVAAAGL
jgi:hypothetical protein